MFYNTFHIKAYYTHAHRQPETAVAIQAEGKTNDNSIKRYVETEVQGWLRQEQIPGMGE